MLAHFQGAYEHVLKKNDTHIYEIREQEAINAFLTGASDDLPENKV